MMPFSLVDRMPVCDIAVSYTNNLNIETMGYDAFQFGRQIACL